MLESLLNESWPRWAGAVEKNWQKHVLSKVFVPLYDSGDYRKCVFLASSPRSGSTWLQELLNHDNSYRIMFEPFQPTRVPETAGSGNRTYLRVGQQAPAVERILHSVVTGKLRNRWVDRFNRRWFADRRLVKSVRSNLLLPWLANSYPEMRIVYLLRHPLSVTASRKRMGWGNDISMLLDQPNLVQDFLRPHREAMSKADEFERSIYKWAVAQVVPLTLLKRGQALVVFYEDLVASPQTELEAVFRFTSTPGLHRALKRVPRLSALARPELRGRGSRAVNFSTTELERTQEILARFGLDALYGPEKQPRDRASAAESFECLAPPPT